MNGRKPPLGFSSYRIYCNPLLRGLSLAEMVAKECTLVYSTTEINSLSLARNNLITDNFEALTNTSIKNLNLNNSRVSLDNLRILANSDNPLLKFLKAIKLNALLGYIQYGK
ncbi:hypothetical protein BCY86_06595 [Pajaroellobacter abortibovis]|uniref:Uncharacterized protein n=1 Tax=Pajaroellobacter abortibovis TaxID=1882918 RepID=A0A1L6MY05_9BACT|nr:hypothetical protein BCY86_06595 [Pajaroellobacter abortibovis]